jgi:hypothetical protein
MYWTRCSRVTRQRLDRHGKEWQMNIRDDALIALIMLVGELERAATAYFTDHRAFDAARRALIDEVRPAALRLLGESAARA